MNMNVSLSSKAYEAIKANIMRGKLAAGEIVSISGLAEELGISRTPVTLACQRLEFEKFLTVAPKQGVVINTISTEEVREIYELRAAIESYAAKNGFSNFTQEDIAYLRQSNEKQKQSIASRDPYAFMLEDTAFHKFILSKHGNSHASFVLGNIYDRAFLMGLKSSQNTARMQEAVKQHDNIIAALVNGDRQAFIDTLEENVLSGYANITQMSYL